MKRTRYIACWLLVVYLLTAIGPACASLTCRCRVMTACTEAVDGHHHGPDSCCRHSSIRTTSEQSAWDAPCCTDRHSTEIALYTNGNDERPDRIVLPVLTALLPDNLPTVAPDAILTDRSVDRRTPLLCRGIARCTGLRAPPSRS